MTRTLLIEEGPIETRAALLDGGDLLEIHIERPETLSRVGLFYLGRIAKILPDMNIAFVDIGGGETGFLQLGDLASAEKSISRALHEGEKLLLQVRKDATGDKGIQLGARYELAGNYLVFRPGGRGLLFAKNLRDETRRAALRSLLAREAEDAGLTIRTSAEEARDAEITADLARLRETWAEAEAAAKIMKKPGLAGSAPSPLHLLLDRCLAPGLDIIVNNVAALNGVKRYRVAHPQMPAGALTLWTEPTALFEAMEVEAGIERALRRRLTLPSGANIVIEPTEALTVIDVNSAGRTAGDGRRSAALAVNMEAAAEICHQIRLRNLGGIIIIDFIQMNGKGEARELTAALEAALARDPVPTRVVGMTELGLMQITRKRQRQPLRDLMLEPCPPCGGDGFRKSDAALLADLFRALQRSAPHVKSAALRIRTGSALAFLLQKHQSRFEAALARPLVLETDATMDAFQYEVS